MSRRLRASPFIAALFLAVAALLTACGGGGGEALTIQEYFQRLDAIFEDADERGQALADPGEIIGDPQSSLEQKRDAVAAFFNEFLAIIADFGDGIEALDLPAEVQDAHDDFLAIITDFQQAGEEAVDKVDAAQSDTELEGIAEEFFGAGEGFTGACLALQAIADANNVAVDLECEEEEAAAVLSLEQYFPRIDAIFEGSDEQLDQLEADLNDALDAATTVDEQVEALQAFLQESNRVLFLSISQLGTIEPPAEAHGFHDDFVSRLEESAQLSEDFLNDVAAAATEAEVEQLIQQFDLGLSQISAGADQACFALQAVADDNNIDVDLNCED